MGQVLFSGRTPLAVLCAIFALTGLARGAHPVDEVARLVTIIEREKNAAKRKDIDALAKIGTEEAFEASQRVTRVMTGTNALRNVFRAFAHYAGTPFEEPAIEFLHKSAMGGRDLSRRGAAFGLARFGEAAKEAQHAVLEDSKDALCRAHVLRPLLGEFGARGTPEAFLVLLENVRMEESGGRTKVVEALARFKGEACAEVALEFMDSRNAREDVRAMLLDALKRGERATFEAALAIGVRRGEGRLAYSALALALEKGVELPPKVLRRQLESKDQDVRRAALLVLARMEGGDPEFVEELLDWSRARDVVKRQAAVVALADVRSEPAVARLYELLSDEEARVRRAALKAVGSLRRLDSIPHLIGRIQAERGGIRQDVTHTLRLLTGLDHGEGPERWKRWWDKEQERVSLPTLAEAAAKERQRKKQGEKRSKSSFYGLDVVSDHVCFVVDTSSSMKTKGKSGEARIAVARREMRRSLESFPEGQLLNVIYFDEDVRPWQDELVVMNDRRRKDALEDLASQRMGNATAIYDALEVAFDDPRVDTIYLMSDGSPSRGTIDDIAEIRREVKRWNSTRHVTVHCIAVGNDHQLLENLAADSRGEYRRVD